MSESWALLWRFLEIHACVARHAALAVGAWLGARLTSASAARRQERFGRRLTLCLEDLGATFVKVGQVLSSRPDLLPREVVEPLRRLQDQVAPFASRRLPALVEEALGRPIDEVFADFDERPVASASVAQVYRAWLPDGRKVAVKIRRPGVVAVVRRDLRLLGLLARWLDRVPAMRLVPFTELVTELGWAVEQQLDFVREAANNRRFRHHFKGVDRITFPKLVDELCCESLLVMEFLDDLEKVDAEVFDQKARQAAAVAGLRALYRMIFVDGFVHADLHPGNVYLRAWGEVVLLDVGLIAELDEKRKQAFVDFFLGMVTGDGERCAQVVEDTAIFRADSYDAEAFTAAMVELIGRHSQLPASEFEVTRFAVQLFDTQRRHGIRGSVDFTMTILSLAVYEGIVKKLHPELDFQREARGYLITARYRRHQALAS